MSDPDTSEKVRIMILWSDDSIDSGRNATEVLRGLCGGWNPPTITGLRKVLANRCGIDPPTQAEPNLYFLRRLAVSGAIKLYEVDESEWSS